MLQSMTGFATKTLTLIKNNAAPINITISIKSLNSRFFEVSVKLPYALSNSETAIVKRIKNKLLRGHIFVTIHMSNPNVLNGGIDVSLNTLKNYLSAIDQIKKTFQITQDITLDHIIRLPNIFITQEEGLDSQSEALILQNIDELVDKVIIERNQEGAALWTDLQSRLSSMHKEIDAIEQRSQLVLTEHKHKISITLQELQGDDTTLAETRKSTLYALLDKMDIHEEIIRFKSHLNNLEHLLKSSNIEKGKRIDFTLQELAREINTITAKCNDYQIGANAINIKVEIEKSREQTQNIV